ncbi:hypothetical protein POM88_000911 [Heracleum sosnowskyi]|uniref:TF-B3 domain-containing protein n=1 Tax=Heracleum sosnowskyi TaxID=360622 RepID=A0AAD8JEU0_9APIA|nr:hypothetical protein POM88_000911 [Heracleum sosnowskyi]
MIPEKFVRKEELRGRIILKAPGGAPWAVDVERRKGEVWLCNGWPDFATFYSLSFGYLLVFEYVEHSNFRVRVFNPNATEIDYPLTDYNLNPDDEIENVVPIAKKRVAEIVKSSGCELIRACKKTRPSSQETFLNGPKLEQANGDGGSSGRVENERPLDLAKAFESQNPYFIFPMRPSYLHSADITKTFRETYSKWKNKDRVIFQVARTSWPVGCSLNGDRCTLTTGWMRFIKDNLLNAGDVCVFELINPSRKLFKVFIYQAKCEAA